MNNLKDFLEKRERICIIGLGYVGLPLAVLFSSKYDIIGFDINTRRIEELKKGHDRTGEVSKNELSSCSINFTDNSEVISKAKVVIVTVPTPIDKYNRPDLTNIYEATKMVGRKMQKGAVVVYESTVYPGVTEEECVPILERESKLSWKKDFFVGYSPERVNPGDREHTIDKIVKVVSGDCESTVDFLGSLYGAVIKAGVHKTPDIKTAEAAKVIENTQRDLNIALMNELAVIFDKLGIETSEVLKAAGTKWNFLPFYPGLVGGHCIGVDPYYLTFKAESMGYHPQVILAGRRINDSMGERIAEITVKKLIKAGKAVKGSKVLILGLTFKENIPDIRNTRVVDIYKELLDYDIKAYVYEPNADKEEVKRGYGIPLIETTEDYKPYDAVIAAVNHESFAEAIDLQSIKHIQNDSSPVLIDVKGLYNKEDAISQDFIYWRL